jgi:AcrR family transcriptional regulator
MVTRRSAQAHHKVLQATLALFVERGIDATSMDGIAEASGVSKATIYKHWPDKDALAIEALALLFGLHEKPPKFDSGDLRKDFVDALTYQPAEARQELKNRIMPHVMAYAARNREFGDKWRSFMIEVPQNRFKTLLKRGMDQDQLVRDIDLSTGLALLLGPMLYWHIVIGRKSATALPSDLATRVVDAFWKAHGKPGRGGVGAAARLRPMARGRRAND